MSTKRTYWIGKTNYFGKERVAVFVQPRMLIPPSVFRDLHRLTGISFELSQHSETIVFEFVMPPAPSTIERAEKILQGALFKRESQRK